KLSMLNKLRRNILEQFQNYNISKCSRNFSKVSNSRKSSYRLNDNVLSSMRTNVKNNAKVASYKTPKISLLLNVLDNNFNYLDIEDVNDIYIPLKYFTNRKYDRILKTISSKFDTYIYMPTIVKGNYKNLFYANAEKSV